jgi:hypothetical protein
MDALGRLGERLLGYIKYGAPGFWLDGATYCFNLPLRTYVLLS